MANSLTRWINALRFRRSNKEEMPEILADYFETGINLDEEVAGHMGLEPQEMERWRHEHKS